MEYNIPVVQPISLADEMSKWGELRSQRQQQKLMDMKMQQMPEELAMQKQQAQANLAHTQTQQQSGALEYDIKKHMAAADVATRIKGAFLKTGLDPKTPQGQQALDQIVTPFKPYLSNITGKPADNQPANWDAITAVADSTPGEQQQAAIQGKVAEQQALMPGAIQQEQAKYGYQHQGDIEKEQRAFDRQKKLVDLNNEYAQKRVDSKQQANVNKPLPTQALKLVQENNTGIGIASESMNDIKSLISSLDNKELDLGMINNLSAKAKNVTGFSDDNSRRYGEFNLTMEKLRNNILQMAKGTQTEGDAQRAMKQIMSSPNDNANVKTQLAKLAKAFENDASIRAMNNDQINANYGKEPTDISKYKEMQPTVSAGGQYKSPDEVKAAVRNGALSRDDAIKVLNSQFGMK